VVKHSGSGRKRSRARIAILFVRGMARLTLLIMALRDIRHRPVEEIRGPKWLWALVTLSNPLPGSLAYLIFGRRPGDSDDPLRG
jgi:hypothetical protein